MKAGKIVFGTESTIDMINKNKVKLIILAKDTAQRFRDCAKTSSP